jgi:hypothetical protein
VLGLVVITLDGVDAPAAVTATAGHTLEETPKAMPITPGHDAIRNGLATDGNVQRRNKKCVAMIYIVWIHA